MASGSLPNFKIRMTTSLDDQGKCAIEMNMEDLLGNESFRSIYDSNRKCLVHLLVDGVNVDERVDVDMSQLPNRFTGLCLHCKNPNFIDHSDIIRIQTNLDREGEDMSNVHLAKEVEVWCLGLNDRDVTFLFPVACVPTCKKDYELEESTHTVAEVASAIRECYVKMNLQDKLGPLSTADSDGASQFRKGIGQVLCEDLPPNIRNIYRQKCLLFNTVGGDQGMTPACDLDHILGSVLERG